MSEKYSSEFKAKVALDAVAQGRTVIEKIAEKHGVSEEEVIAWAAQLQQDAAKIFGVSPVDEFESEEDVPKAEDVTITTDNKIFQLAVDRRVTKDDLNYNKLIFWSALGTGLLIVFVVGLVYFTQYSLFETQREASRNSQYSEVGELHAAQREELNSFGVVDLENGIYKVPIDSVINRMAID